MPLVKEYKRTRISEEEYKRRQWEKHRRQKEKQKSERRNESGLTKREQEKLDKISKVKEIKSKGLKQKEIAEILGISNESVNNFVLCYTICDSYLEGGLYMLEKSIHNASDVTDILENLEFTKKLVHHNCELIKQKHHIEEKLRRLHDGTLFFILINGFICIAFFTYLYIYATGGIITKLLFSSIVISIFGPILVLIMTILWKIGALIALKLGFFKIMKKSVRRQKKEKELQESLKRVEEELNSNYELLRQSLVPEAYRKVHVVGKLIFYFKNCRADTMKEALNLYEEERQRSEMIEQARRSEIAANEVKMAAYEARAAAESAKFAANQASAKQNYY